MKLIALLPVLLLFGFQDGKTYDDAADYSAKLGGLSVLVMIDGKVVYERYDNGHSSDKPVHLRSGTKGFWSVGCAAMVEDGLFTYDEPVSDTITEWKKDDRKRPITVRHLLQLNSGLLNDIPMLQGFQGKAKDKYGHAVGLRCAARPGAWFNYGPGHYYALGEFLKRKLKKDPLVYLKKRILDPIGVEVADWKHDDSGNAHMPNGAHLTARNWAKFGRFLLQKGTWEGKAIVKEEAMEECLKPSRPNAGFGLSLWLNKVGGKPSRSLEKSMKTGKKGGFIYPDGHPDLFAALGAGKCRMYMFPTLKMVVVRQSDTRRDRYEDAEFLKRILKP